MELTLKELQEHLNDQKVLLVDIFIIHKNIVRLQEDKYEYEAKIKEHGFFEALGGHLKFVLCVQLSKLYGSRSSDKRSFLKLCNKLENLKYDNLLEAQISSNNSNSANLIKSREDVKQLVTDIKKYLSTKNDVVERLIKARDKVYAHTDPCNEKIRISWEELRALINLASEIYNLLNFKFFFGNTLFKEVKDWDIDYVFYHISKSEKAKADELKRKLQGLTKP